LRKTPPPVSRTANARFAFTRCIHALRSRCIHALHARAAFTRYIHALRSRAARTRYIHALHSHVARCTLHSRAAFTRYAHALHSRAAFTRCIHACAHALHSCVARCAHALHARCTLHVARCTLCSSDFLKNVIVPRGRPLRIKQLIVHGIPKHFGKKGIAETFKREGLEEEGHLRIAHTNGSMLLELLSAFSFDSKEKSILHVENETCYFQLDVPVCGDVRFVFYQVKPKLKKKISTHHLNLGEAANVDQSLAFQEEYALVHAHAHACGCACARVVFACLIPGKCSKLFGVFGSTLISLATRSLSACLRSTLHFITRTTCIHKISRSRFAFPSNKIGRLSTNLDFLFNQTRITMNSVEDLTDCVATSWNRSAKAQENAKQRNLIQKANSWKTPLVQAIL
jgi:hypothetical protein